MNQAWIYFMISLVTSLAFGPIVIPRLRKLKFGQAIREDGPEAHLVKSGTPTMGGLIFVVAFLTPLLVFLNIESYEVIFVVVGMVGFGAIGFIDDYLKVVKKHNLGLRAKQKIVMQLVVGIVVAYLAGRIGTEVHLPFIGTYVDFKWLFYPFAVFMAVGFNNAVNLTDGLDGLAASVTFVVSVFFAVVSWHQGNELMIIVNLAMAGALLGYLRYNWYPAKVFMGDTGSLALGGYVVAVAFALKMPFILLIVGIVYVIETLSVIIQVLVFKKTRKRIFKMAPIHHHFELSGWHEKKIVFVFTGLTALGAFVAYLSII
jgi:phospho-N-acetylmuramoyl-pentapeptide-transferase